MAALRQQLAGTRTYFFYLQRICNHCTYPGCLAACPRKAIYKRPEDGIVLIDQNRCRGQKCVEQCPFKTDVPGHDPGVGKKCVACYPRIEGKDPLTGGEPMETRCMAACVGKIRMQSLMRIGEDGLWAKTAGIPCTTRFIMEQVALPLYPQWGTEPNGYTSRHGAARGYARQMFGLAWITPSRSTSCPAANCWRSSSSGEPASRSSSGTMSSRSESV